jgi:hypothetical protein
MAEIQPQTPNKMAATNTQSKTQSARPDGQRAIQQDLSSPGAVTRQRILLPYPHWPTSRPGPLAKQAPSGQKPINVLRREQMVEVG